MRGPLLSFPTPAAWGVTRRLIESLTQPPADLADARRAGEFQQRITTLSSRFVGRELEPELIDLFQLEAIGALHMFSTDDFDYPMEIGSRTSTYLDEVIASSSARAPSFESFASRNEEIARLCFSSSLTSQRLALCDAFSADLVAALNAQAFPSY
jgi:hypothetical protein